MKTNETIDVVIPVVSEEELKTILPDPIREPLPVVSWADLLTYLECRRVDGHEEAAAYSCGGCGGCGGCSCH